MGLREPGLANQGAPHRPMMFLLVHDTNSLTLDVNAAFFNIMNLPLCGNRQPTPSDPIGTCIQLMPYCLFMNHIISLSYIY